MKKISLTIFNYGFIFSSKSLAVLIVIFTFLCSLGVWQLHRANIKKKLLSDYSDHIIAKPLTLEEVKELRNLNYYSIQLKGHYDLSHIVFLDNKIYQHQVGYEVLVPFIPENSDQKVLINLGWIARGKSRNTLPPIELPTGGVVLNGIIRVIEKPGITLGENIEKMQGPALRIQTLQIDKLGEYLKTPFYPFEVLLVSDGMKDQKRWVRDWRPSLMIMPSRHVGYAIQWFALAVAFVVVFVVMHGRRL